MYNILKSKTIESANKCWFQMINITIKFLVSKKVDEKL